MKKVYNLVTFLVLSNLKNSHKSKCFVVYAFFFFGNDRSISSLAFWWKNTNRFVHNFYQLFDTTFYLILIYNLRLNFFFNVLRREVKEEFVTVDVRFQTLLESAIILNIYLPSHNWHFISSWFYKMYYNS